MNAPRSRGASPSAPPGDLFADTYQECPYWWRAAPPEAADGAAAPADRVDVAVIGGGVTGTVAALHLARGGASVAVLDGASIGDGAARRNAGFLGRTLKRSLDWLERHEGEPRARAVYDELNQALSTVRELAAAEGIRCHVDMCGRVVASNSEQHHRLLVADLRHMARRLGFRHEELSRADLRRELASDAYVGGALLPELGSIHPGLYHKGLVEAARAAGVSFVPQARVARIDRQAAEFVLSCASGPVRAEHVIVATNGYTTRDLPWHARRVIPFRGFVIATETLPAELIARVLPNRRTYLDTKVNIDFIRTAPGEDRIIFGGMTGSRSLSARELAPRLYARMTRILPDLAGRRIAFGWTGYCAGTLDFMPHIGEEDGIHYAMGYNFAGVPIGTLFGLKLAKRILGEPGGESAFGQAPFRSTIFYRGSRGGSPWFVPMTMRAFDWQDSRLARREPPAAARKA